jgi:Mg-chelatase subunit ChlD
MAITLTRSPKGFDTVLCLDVSGSMAGRGLQQLQAAALRFIDGVEQIARRTGIEENISLVTFQGDNASILVPLTTSFNVLRHAIRSLSANGGTPMAKGLLAARIEIQKNGGLVRVGAVSIAPRIVLFTDGKPDNKQETLVMALALGREHHRVGLPYAVPVACVGCGDVDDELLQGVALITGGMYCRANNLDELTIFFLRQVLLAAFLVQFANDLQRLRDIAAFAAFMQQQGQHLSAEELRVLHAFLLAMIVSEAGGGGGGGGGGRGGGGSGHTYVRIDNGNSTSTSE